MSKCMIPVGDIVRPTSSWAIWLADACPDGTPNCPPPRWNVNFTGVGVVLEARRVTFDFNTWPSERGREGKEVFYYYKVSCNGGSGWTTAVVPSEKHQGIANEQK